jgi:2-polyprenyl-3-methyl-5-hydroxy-6-metoxy-1,4-benzoquinol methylase
MSTSADLYDEFAPYYGEYAHQRDGYLKTLDDIIINFIESQRRSTTLDIRSVSMLDVGAGDGKRAFSIANKLNFKKLTLLDSSPEMIKLCKSISDSQVILGDISTNNFFLKRENYQIITCLWNVLGHIDTPEKRLLGLKNIYKLTSPGGFIFLDVNNRYNIKNYGVKNVLRNLLKDIFCPSSDNGDINFVIKIKSKEIFAQVHIFNPYEIESLIRRSGLKLVKKYRIDYSTGKVSKFFLTGQLFYILSK